MEFLLLFILAIAALVFGNRGSSLLYRLKGGRWGKGTGSGKLIWRWLFQSGRERRRDYYRNEYLKSDAWQRKRYVVMKRDNWRCVYCGRKATQVHHKKYARRNIGREPIEWLVSVCRSCHEALHLSRNT